MHSESSFSERLRAARELSWRHFGKNVVFYLPGMFQMDGVAGKYPAISITGGQCALSCDHCGGKILDGMPHAPTPEELIRKCRRLAAKGNLGVLISGGCDAQGRLPWDRFIPAIRTIKTETGLFVSVHSGLLDDRQALELRKAGVDQALIDVVGDDETYRKVCHVSFGVGRIESTLSSLQKAGLPTVPHIVCGLHYGRMRGEKQAVKIISGYHVQQVVVVSLMNIRGTRMQKARCPAAEDMADIIAEARFAMPKVPVSLGCARRRGDSRLEILALEAGVNRLALPSDEAMEKAESLGLNIRFQPTCCSVPCDLSASCRQAVRT